MNRQPLGKLEQVDLRFYWFDEARDFTPWLASEEGLALLGDTIGLDLELVGQEKRVGPFKADILAQVEGVEEQHYVVIENQLEKTNHDHLGKIITYSAGLGAATIVWIAENFTDEHRQALDWLNTNVGENLAFFGLQIELWRIGASAPAPQFKVVSSPNEWANLIKIVPEPPEVTETKLEQQTFWDEVRAYIQTRKSPLTIQAPRPQHWATLKIGRSGFRISLTLNSIQKRVGCELYITRREGKLAYDMLYEKKKEIELALGLTLEWQRLDNKKASRIVIYRSGLSIDEPVQREQAKQWLIEMAEKFHAVFAPRVAVLDLSSSEEIEVYDDAE